MKKVFLFLFAALTFAFLAGPADAQFRRPLFQPIRQTQCCFTEAPPLMTVQKASAEETFIGSLVGTIPYKSGSPILMRTPNYYALRMSDAAMKDVEKYVNTSIAVRVTGTVINSPGSYVEVLDVRSIEPFRPNAVAQGEPVQAVRTLDPKSFAGALQTNLAGIERKSFAERRLERILNSPDSAKRDRQLDRMEKHVRVHLGLSATDAVDWGADIDWGTLFETILELLIKLLPLFL